MTPRQGRLCTVGGALLLALGQGLEGILYLADTPHLSVLLLVAAALGGSSALVMPWRDAFGTPLIIGTLAGTAMTGHILVLEQPFPRRTGAGASRIVASPTIGSPNAT